MALEAADIVDARPESPTAAAARSGKEARKKAPLRRRVPPKPPRRGPPIREPDRKPPVREPPAQDPPRAPVREPPDGGEQDVAGVRLSLTHAAR